MASAPAILALIEAIKTHFQHRQPTGDAVGREIAKVLALLEPLPPLTGAFPRRDHPSTRHLASAFEAGNAATADLLAAIRPVAHDLPWRYSYAKRDDAPGLEENMAFAEIIGPEAPFRSDRVCLGLTLIGPETLYPAHAHPAIELYAVAAGTATWMANGASHRNPPGAFILHPGQAVHAMQTHREPLLAVYSWSGADIQTLSSYTS
jgi:hypothetical protein